ncbi:MAG: flavohemoprotein [Nannocystaceae bacterium]|nr:flavohemoprotein [Nannocystaceae bacterium]
MSNAQLLQDNLELVVSRDPDLMLIFYGFLFDRYPEVKPLFGRNSREEQAKMLTEAVGMLVANMDDPEFVRTTMLSVGQKHVDYGVEDHMYAWVGECLVATLAQVSADAWTAELETAWTEVLTAISSIAIEGGAALRNERKHA